ncbi:MAG TPA: cyclic pyranopterin monophosphate synthase MoaC [Gammaproteobacteria bacterium]|nr:cyclic pyranopterin monophosphate synthase MoaC [Gammaproteobacteria bacterium]
MEQELTHFNRRGEAHMVDVAAKQETHRTAIADGRIQMEPATLQKIIDGDHKKGDVLGIARVAAIMAAKRTADIVPLCHPLRLTRIDIQLQPEHDANTVYCRAQVESRDRTGVEMEALHAVQVALLTIYDMCKAVDRGMRMQDIGLAYKSGGKSATWERV